MGPTGDLGNLWCNKKMDVYLDWDMDVYKTIHMIGMEQCILRLGQYVNQLKHECNGL